MGKKLFILVAILGIVFLFKLPNYAQEPSQGELQQQVFSLQKQLKEVQTQLQKVLKEQEKQAEKAEAQETRMAEVLKEREEEKVPRRANFAGDFLEGKLGGEIRVRPEVFENLADWSNEDDTDQGDVWSTRARLNFSMNFRENVRGFVEIQTNNLFGDDAVFNDLDLGGRFGTGEDDIKFYQGYIDVDLLSFFGTPLTARLGRQELVYGREWLIGDSDFGPGLSFDALKFIYDTGKYRVDLWYSKLLEDSVAARIGRSSRDVYFLGGYGTIKDILPIKFITNQELDLFALHLDDDRGLGPVRDRHKPGSRLTGNNVSFWTIGGRFSGKLEDSLTRLGAMDYNVELAWQMGDNGTGRISADARELGVGYTFEKFLWTPRIGIVYTFASGDDDPFDDDNKTFNPLFEDNHPRFGYSDLFLLENINILDVSLGFKPIEKLGVRFNYLNFSLDQNSDFIGPRAFQARRIAGAPFTSAAFRPKDRIANELDISFDYKFSDNLFISLVGVYLAPEDFIRDVFGGKDSVKLGYLNVQLKF